MRIVGNRAFCLRAGVLAILCTLAFAASAMADASIPTTEPEATPTQSGQEAGGAPAGESTSPAAEQTPSEGAGPGTEPIQESAGTGGTPESTGGGGPSSEEAPPVPVVPETPPVTETGEGTPATPGPGVETTPEPTPLVVTEPGAQESSTVVPVGKAGEEEAPASGSHAVVNPESGMTQTAAARAESGETTQGPSVATIDALTPPPAGPTASGLEAQASTPPGAGAGGGRGAPGAMSAAQRSGSLTCELSALGGRTTDNCTVGWLGGKRFIGSSAGVIPAVGSLAAAAASAGLPPDGGHGGSAVGNTPVSPAPGPAPSGASGAAVGGASGAPPSAFLSLAGLLLLAAPRALRRLRLSCRPWLTACFVLIPERPG